MNDQELSEYLSMVNPTYRCVSAELLTLRGDGHITAGQLADHWPTKGPEGPVAATGAETCEYCEGEYSGGPYSGPCDGECRCLNCRNYWAGGAA